MSRFITKTIHAYLDYPVALGLIAMPVILGIGASNPIAFWLSVSTGIAALVLTLLTDHKTGVIRVIPYQLHLAVDFIVGIVFVAAPHALGLAGLDFWYFTLIGLTVIAVVGLHKSETTVLSPAV